ncbi:MAG: flagellar basal body P-ring formation chaperone FlgA [Armatimonadetes bacterium]|nr:flagellar basal body P-ring formation chaperone FlgA [Armatimonadota bacterium]
MRSLLFLSLSFLTFSALAQHPTSKKLTLKGSLKMVLPKGQTDSTANSPVIITVRVTNEVNSDFFKLGEIADIAGRDTLYKKRLAEVEIGRAPLPGYARSVTPGDIVIKLRAAKLESDRIELVAPPSVSVTRSKSDVATSKLAQIALNTVREALGETPGTSFEALPPMATPILPAGAVRYIAGAFRGNPETGNIVVPISILVDDKPQQTIDVTVKVKRKIKVVVVTRIVESRDILTSEDVMLSQIELPSGFIKPVTTLKEAIGKRVKRRLFPDSPLSSALLETPPAINAQDKVTLDFTIGQLQVTALVTARQSGAVGDTIRVYCEDTKKEIEATIVDSKTVRLPGTN